MQDASEYGNPIRELAMCGVSASYSLFSTGLHAFGPRRPCRLYELVVDGAR